MMQILIMIIECSINEESIVDTIGMLRAEKQGHRIFWDGICFAKVTLKNDVHSRRNVNFENAPFFNLMENLKGFVDENRNEEYAKSTLTCIDQFYSFKIEKEGSLLLFSNFVGWEKWEPVKIRHEGIEKEIQRSCRQFLKDYSARLPMLLNYSQIDLIKKHFGV